MHRAAVISNNNDWADERGNCRIRLRIQAILAAFHTFHRFQRGGFKGVASDLTD
jgi:hypothetical protein